MSVKQRQSPAVTSLRFVVGLCLDRTAGEIEAAILARGKALEARADNDRTGYLRLLRNDETLRLLKASRSVKASMATMAEAMPALLAALDLPDTAESRTDVVDTFWNAALSRASRPPAVRRAASASEARQRLAMIDAVAAMTDEEREALDLAATAPAPPP